MVSLRGPLKKQFNGLPMAKCGVIWISKVDNDSLGTGAHAYNFSFSGGKNQED
jgi:hypothetical protein